jgi:ADP-heptose:LPS heptosyltransferase
MLAPLAKIDGLKFVSLQKDGSPGAIPELIDWTSELHDLADTAALIQNLDLVVTIDTAVAHLAGAMGKPVWVLLPFVPDWRWMLDRNDSPWYPTMKLFRQSSPGDWTEPVGRVIAELNDLKDSQ